MASSSSQIGHAGDAISSTGFDVANRDAEVLNAERDLADAMNPDNNGEMVVVPELSENDVDALDYLKGRSAAIADEIGPQYVNMSR